MTRRPLALLAAAALLSLAAAPALAQEAVTDPAQAAQLAAAVLAPRPTATLTVTSPAFPPGGDIPFENTRYRDNRFPGLAWTRGPRGARSYAVIMQDPDSQANGVPILHWTTYDIPAAVTRLEPGMTSPPPGAQLGPNIRGPSQPYAGPRTPAGPKHHYHFQVFALDATVAPDPALTYPQLIAALQGHVVAEGELIGLGRRDPDAPPPAPPTGVPPKPPG